MARPSSLATHPRDLVLRLLKKRAAPMSAYDLLDALKSQGVKAPPIIYRALATLVEQGKAHRVQALNAYVACTCAADHTHHLSVLTVCGACHGVEELHDHKLLHHLEGLRRMKVNLPPHAVIELPVTCQRCIA